MLKEEPHSQKVAEQVIGLKTDNGTRGGTRREGLENPAAATNGDQESSSII